MPVADAATLKAYLLPPEPEPTPEPTPEPKEEPKETIGQESKGGSGRTGVGPRSPGSSNSYTETTGERGSGRMFDMPDWFDNVIMWYSTGVISKEEFFAAYAWLQINY